MALLLIGLVCLAVFAALAAIFTAPGSGSGDGEAAAGCAGIAVVLVATVLVVLAVR